MTKTTTKRPMGRPPIRGATADKQLKVYVTEEERQLVRDAAEVAGTSIGQWLVTLAVAAAKKELKRR